REHVGLESQRLQGAIGQQGQRLDSESQRVTTTIQRLDQTDRRVSQLSDGRYDRRTVSATELRFGFNRADLADGAQTALNEIAKQLKADTRLSVDVIGHTDRQGATDYNVQLSQRRAEAVRRWLALRDIDLSRIHAIGLGPTRSDGKAVNQRTVTVRLTMHGDADPAEPKQTASAQFVPPRTSSP